MRTLRAVVAAAVLCLAVTATGPARAQTPSPAPAPAVALPHFALTREALAGLPRSSVTVTEEDGKSATYSGVQLGALLAKNGAPQGAAIRGSAAADYVVVRASDGYRVVFALIELDPRFTAKTVLVADQRDGAAIGADGPLRLVVPDEKHHARWVRNAIDVQVFNAP